MGTMHEVQVPDIGDFKDVPVIEVLVSAGDAVSKDTPLVVLETDKATMEVPSPFAGVVRELKVKVGDRLSKGKLLLILESGDAAVGGDVPTSPVPTSLGQTPVVPQIEVTPLRAAWSEAAGAVQEVKVPDIGDFKDVPVIEVLVSTGDAVSKDTPLVVLETDKATMEVPSPFAGVVRELKVKVGDRLSKGKPLLMLEAARSEAKTVDGVVNPAQVAQSSDQAFAPGLQVPASPRTETDGALQAESSVGLVVRASPAVRKRARELSVDLLDVKPSGPRGHITRNDVDAYVRTRLTQASAGAPGVRGTDLLPWPQVDFAKFGEIERRPLSRLRKISGANLSRNWVMIPHVTNFDEADITELEAFRVQLNREQADSASKLTMLAFLLRAVVETLRIFPDFNASLDGEVLIQKRYFHVGFAADTPNGLVVPVIRDVDRKGLRDIARELGELAALARSGKLKPEQMQGGCFSVSSLGGIGGTGFTPIINAPEVAILGVTRAEEKPKWDGAQFRPRLMLPLSLSWDHRVIDGAAAARFLRHLASLLADFRRVML